MNLLSVNIIHIGNYIGARVGIKTHNQSPSVASYLLSKSSRWRAYRVKFSIILYYYFPITVWSAILLDLFMPLMKSSERDLVAALHATAITWRRFPFVFSLQPTCFPATRWVKVSLEPDFDIPIRSHGASYNYWNH